MSKRRADEQRKKAQVEKKYGHARSALTKAKTESQIRSKQRALDSIVSKKTSIEKAISDTDDKYARKAKEVSNLELQLSRAQEKEAKLEQRRVEEIKRKNALEHAHFVTSMNNQHVEINALNQRIMELEAPHEKISVLMLASSPKDCDDLRLGEEARVIRHSIELAKLRDSVVLEDRWAVQVDDLFQAVNGVDPTIVHFSGHGSLDGSILLEDRDGTSKYLQPDKVAIVVSSLSPTLRLIVFNACCSADQAAEVVNHVQASVRMSRCISDGAAICFAKRFYSAIGHGLSLQKAFEQGRAALAIDYTDEYDIPQLYVADGFDSSDIYYVSGN